MGRRASREAAMKLLYQLEIQRDDRDEQINTVLEDESLTASDRKYIRSIVDGVSENVEQLDKIIEKYAMGWKINRISKIDLSVLRIGIYEILFREDIPYSVSVNEAVELAKKYSNEDAGAFVNGLLAKVTKEDQKDIEPVKEKAVNNSDSGTSSESVNPSDK